MNSHDNCVLCYNRPSSILNNWTQIPSEISFSCNTYLSFEIVQAVSWAGLFKEGQVFCHNCYESITRLSNLHIQLQNIQTDINQLSSYINHDVLAQRMIYQSIKTKENENYANSINSEVSEVSSFNATKYSATPTVAATNPIPSSDDSNSGLNEDFLGFDDSTEVEDRPKESNTSSNSQNKSPYSSGFLKNGGLKCSKCSRTFLRATILASHDCDKASYDCETCGLSFSAPSVLKTHKSRVHGGIKPFKCNICGKAFGFKHHLVPHMRLHTGEKPFECDICGSRFIARKVLVEHKRRHDKNCYSCDTCYKRFEKMEIFAIHLRIHLQPECETCNKHSSITTQELGQHLKTHGRPKPHICDQCGKGFETNRSLEIHITSHATGKNLQCDQCGKKFKCEPALKNHVATEHSRPETHVCEVCGKTSFHLAQHRQHLKTHPDKDQELKCEFCGKMFKYQKSLTSHIGSFHGGEKPYKCEQCEKAFACKVSLKTHKKMHLDISERYLISCKICKKSFKTNTLLVEHQIISHEVTAGFPVVCQQCDSKFYHLGSYQWHKFQRHKPNQQLVCPICDDSGERFTKCCDLLTHLKDFHPEVEKNLYKCKSCKFTMSPWYLKKHNCINLRVVKKRAGKSGRVSKTSVRNEKRRMTRLQQQLKNGCGNKQLTIKLTRIDSPKQSSEKSDQNKDNRKDLHLGKHNAFETSNKLKIKREMDEYESSSDFEEVLVKMELG